MNNRLISTGVVWLILINGFLGEIISIPNYGDLNNSESVDDSKIITNEVSTSFPGFGNYFTENKGQVEDYNVLYYLHGNVAFTKNSLIFNMREPYSLTHENSLGLNNFNKDSNNNVRGIVFLVHIENSNDVIPIGSNILPHRSNYFLGNDSTKWRTNIANYESIIYSNIYDGIDLIYRMKDGILKYDFVIYPNANPSEICLTYEGIKGLAIKPDGSLMIRTTLGELRDTKPYIFQEFNNVNVEVNGTFKIINKRSFGFEIDESYNKNLPLIIDPGLEWSTYFGGNDAEIMRDITLDSNNNVYITGETFSTDFPTSIGAYDTSLNGTIDAYFAKLSSDGTTVLFSSFFGGSEDDVSTGIEVDINRNVFITGVTRSPDFPTTASAFDPSDNPDDDAFVTKFNNTGNSLIYSTYLGVSGRECAYGITIDSSGCAYIVGWVHSLDFPTTIGAFDTFHNGGLNDVFVTKLNSEGDALNFSTYIGGSDRDVGWDISVDLSGNVSITGETRSSDFPTTIGSINTSFSGYPNNDGFVTKLNSNGSALIFSTFLGGNNEDDGTGISVDQNGNVYVTGLTKSSNFPITMDAYDTSLNGDFDAFVSKITYNGSSLLYSTFFGGNDQDIGYDIAIDSIGNVYITGHTKSSDFPITLYAYDTSINGGDDIFISKLNVTENTLLYSTFLGGSAWDVEPSIAIDNDGNAYIAGWTMSTDFPTTLGAYDTSDNGNTDGFVTKLNLSIPLLPPTPFTIVVNNGTDINLTWTEPLSPNTNHYLIYRAKNQTILNFTNPWKDTSKDKNPHSGKIEPLRRDWLDRDVNIIGHTNYSKEYYYVIRTVNDVGDISITSRTVGKWTREFLLGENTFSLPLKPFEPITIHNFTKIMEANYIKWMDPQNKTWVQHNVTDGPGVRDDMIEVGEGYMVFYNQSSIFTFTGMPGAMIIYDNVSFGFNATPSSGEANCLIATVDMNGNVTLNWTQPVNMNPDDRYFVFRSTTRDGFWGIFGEDYKHISILNYSNLSYSDEGIAMTGTKYYYMVVPVNLSTYSYGSSTYSIGIWTEKYYDGYDTFSLPLKMNNHQTADWFCNNIPDTMGINYYNLSAQRWCWHSTRMSAGAYDPILEMTKGYQISTSNSTKFTFIGV